MLPCSHRGETSGLPAMPAHAGQASSLRTHLDVFLASIDRLAFVLAFALVKFPRLTIRKLLGILNCSFSGKKQEILRNLEKEMKRLAKKQDFEKAGKIRDQIFALNHIRDVSLLKQKGNQDSPLDSLSRRVLGLELELKLTTLRT